MVDVVAESVAAVVAAIGKYGSSVLTRAEDGAAGATVSLGQRLIQKIFHRPGSHDAVGAAVADVAAAPGDQDAVGALRLQLKKALAADPALAGELAEMIRTAGVTVNSEGDRANIAQHNTGIQSSGDNVTITQHQHRR